MSAGRILALIFGVILAPVAIGLVVGGIALIVAFGTMRGSDGFLESGAYPLHSNGYALTSESVAIAPYPGDWWPADLVASIAIEATVAGSPVFIGIGPTADVARYLAGVPHDEVTDIGRRRTDVEYRTIAGTAAPAAPPAAQTFWAATAEGGSPQRLAWDIERGAWTVVVMNADGSAGVTVDAVGAVRIPALAAIGIGTLIGGLVIAAIAAGLLVIAFRRHGGMTPMAPSHYPGEAGSPLVSTYPLGLTGRMDEPLSRWMWLVKWFLAIPHYIMLAFLGIAFVFLTIVAFFAILFTGRYPRSIFDFNVGVMRWGWRVAFYATAVLGTDRYPPFSLADDPDYPARLDVAYPAQLSRGLVLVKWWLLAIPHYIIVGVLTSGLIWWATDFGYGENVLEIGGGIIGVLALVAGLCLLFGGRYPLGLFDLLIGLNRWVFRVVAYATLMTDEYPPFRLDLGGREPGASAAAHDQGGRGPL